MKHPAFFKKRTTAIIVSALLSINAASVAAQTADTKISSLISQMTLDEKISFLHGTVQGFDMANQHDPENKAAVGFIPGLSRLGIPALRLTDGPAGARHPMHMATAMPSPVALAATFKPELAREYGNVIGVEARSLDQDILLSPMVNIVRVPNAGRNFETLGEDPLLAGKMVAAEIEGIQEKGLMATVKHFAGNNQESERGTGVSVIDARTLHEIYLPAFEAAVKANVASFMCSYNRLAIDGQGNDYTCGHKTLLTDILRNQWKYDGFVMTDWYATLFEQKAPDPTPIMAGLDIEMPSSFFMGEPLKKAVNEGKIPVSYVDQAVARILTQMERFHMLDGKMPTRLPMADVAKAHSAIALETAESGAVLLKNSAAMLPLPQADLTDLLVVGPTAAVPVVGGGGSSHVKARASLSPIEALEAAGAKVTAYTGIDLEGVAIPMTALKTADHQAGLVRTLNDKKATVADINLTGKDKLPSHSKVQWDGELVAPETGTYEIKLQVKGGSATLKLGAGDAKGAPQLDTNGFFVTTNRLLPTKAGLDLASFSIKLKKGEKLPLVVTAKSGENNMLSNSIVTADDPLEIKVAWVTPSHRQKVLNDAVAAAKAHKGKVLVFGFNEGTEGQDRMSLSLPDGQDQLISAITKANKNSIVVLNTGDPITMPWEKQTSAILQMWYSGQEGAIATANLLTGKVNPSGKLPVSFPALEKDTPFHTKAQFPGVNGRVDYKEGMLVGYRWYATKQIKPLFAFGHGLTYTNFRYGKPTVEKTADGYNVSFTVTNTGKYAGVDVPQIYAGLTANKAVDLPSKSLVGFERIELKAGETKSVEIPVSARSLSYWDVANSQWKLLGGQREMFVCDSSSCDNNKQSFELQVNKK